jgi:hypothetical protein
LHENWMCHPRVLLSTRVHAQSGHQRSLGCRAVGFAAPACVGHLLCNHA